MKSAASYENLEEITIREQVDFGAMAICLKHLCALCQLIEVDLGSREHCMNRALSSGEQNDRQ